MPSATACDRRSPVRLSHTRFPREAKCSLDCEIVSFTTTHIASLTSHMESSHAVPVFEEHAVLVGHTPLEIHQIVVYDRCEVILRFITPAQGLRKPHPL